MPDTPEIAGAPRGTPGWRKRVNGRALLAWVHDVVAGAVALLAAYAVRLNFEDTWGAFESAIRLLPWLLPVQAVAYWASGLYRGLWRYASLRDMRQIALAAGMASVAIPLVVLLFRLDVVVPRSVLFMHPVFLIFLMAGSRLAYRMWREHKLTVFTRTQGDPVIVVGAGDAATRLLRDLANSSLYRAVALLDDDPRKRGRVIEGVRVVGATGQFADIARQFNTSTAIIAMPSASRDVRRRVVKVCSDAGARILTVPTFEEMMHGIQGGVREIEVEDLLGRDVVQLDLDAMRKNFTGRVVMVTGAGGSIGSEICHQLLRFQPRVLVLFDNSEFALYSLVEKVSGNARQTALVPLIGDVRDKERVEAVLAEYEPGVIFHAAAYKHVPLMEERNAREAVKNNVYGTYVVGTAAIDHGVERFVLVSTDKAVNPTNVMGATKRLAELVCQSLNDLPQAAATRFEIVRFGNVLGSSGSVIPKFQQQIAGGGPVTVTHPEVIRYFMSIPEAAQLVLQAGSMGDGGEVFVLDMGAPVKIVDLARDMIRLAGHTEQQISITFTGLRPGEKLFEELLADGEATLPTPHPKVRVAKAVDFKESWLPVFHTWLMACVEGQTGDDVRADLRSWLPEFQEPEVTGTTPARPAPRQSAGASAPTIG